MKHIIEEHTVTTIEKFYFGQGLKSFFDPRVQGGFFDMMWFLVKCAVFFFAGWFTLFAAADFYGMAAIEKYATMSPACQTELTSAFNNYEK